jgi:hypothetical protein
MKEGGSAHSALRTPHSALERLILGGTVATVGFPDIGLQKFLTTKHTNYTKN